MTVTSTDWLASFWCTSGRTPSDVPTKASLGLCAFRRARRNQSPRSPASRLARVAPAALPQEPGSAVPRRSTLLPSYSSFCPVPVPYIGSPWPWRRARRGCSTAAQRAAVPCALLSRKVAGGRGHAASGCATACAPARVSKCFTLATSIQAAKGPRINDPHFKLEACKRVTALHGCNDSGMPFLTS